MNTPNSNDKVTHDELVQRIELMETMIAEGRSATIRFGWVFVLWGLVDIAGMGWEMLGSHSGWVWPVTIGCGLLLQFAVMSLRRGKGQTCSNTLKSRSISAVWGMMGIAMLLYCFTAIFRGQAWQSSYIAAIFIIVGLAHAISATILRWLAQGFVAALWWAGGLAVFFVPSSIYYVYLFIGEMFFGMVLFGLYAMMLERRTGGGRVSANA